MKDRTLQILLIAALMIAWGSDIQAQGAGQRPIANVGPVEIDFGSINIGEVKTVPVSVRNLTDTLMTFAGGGMGGADGFAGFTGTCGGGLAAGASCQFDYEFRPKLSNAVVVSAQTLLHITAGDRTDLVPIQLRGRGVGTLVDVSPTGIDFGNTFLGQTASVPVTITNRRDYEVSFAGGGFNVSNGFSANLGTCGSTLASGASCQFVYSFTPNSLGLLTNQTSLQIELSGAGVADSYPIEVRGTGVTSVSLVHVRPVSIGFGKVVLGRATTVPIHFTNTAPGIINYAGGGFDPIGSDGGVFSGTLGGGVGCTSNTADIGATCAVNYSMRPNETRAFSGNTLMSFSRNSVDQFQPYQFSGIGVGTLGQVSPVLVDFGTVDLNTTISVPVTVRNDGDQDLTGFLGGAVNDPFSSLNLCTGALAPGNNCTIFYTFNASTASVGLHQTQTAITFTNAQGVQPVYTITLRARGTASLFTDGFE
ncbi:MAG: choice-of-anchor D domain-containing protein [Ahniella sp.]|nr:choice-of-anchor D domain-containing protein [Ahniella sp.]